MDKKILLQKLEKLFEMMGKFESKSNEEIVTWANQVAPILKLINKQYYVNLIRCAHSFNLNLSIYTLEPSFNVMRSQIQMAIEELKLSIEMEDRIPEQMYFPENSYLNIQKNIARVIRQAQNSLYILDAYMDEKIVEELTEIIASEIRLLTNKRKGLFLQRLSALKKQFPTKLIEARCSDKSHDRFYIIDKDQIWTLGASLNKAGQKATLLSKIRNDSDKQKIINDFESWWNLAKKI